MEEILVALRKIGVTVEDPVVPANGTQDLVTSFSGKSMKYLIKELCLQCVID
jgi:hypothetical protein